MNSKQWKHTYIAIDLKSFYASVECVERHLDPLTTNLVVADASRTDKTICLAVTPSLKAYGLSGRSRLYEVVQKAAEIKRETGKELEYITAVPRMSLYIKYSAAIYKIYLKYFAPEDIHVYSIDEVFIDATHYLPFYKTDARNLTQKVIQDILNTTGITATAGIAPNLYLCKVAMDIVAKHIKADQNGVRIAQIDELEYRKKLWNHRPLTDFWRIGPGTEQRLAKNGIFTMGELARRSLQWEDSLYRIFGIDAEILIDHVWGYEPVELKNIKAYRSHSKSLTNGQVLHRPYNFDEALLIVKEMTQLLVLEMVEKEISSASFTLYVGYDISSATENYNGPLSMDHYGRVMPSPAGGTVNFGAPVCSFTKIMNGIADLFQKVVSPDLFVRRIFISANNTANKYAAQPGLFENEPKYTREDSLQNSVVRLQKIYGKNAVLKGINLESAGTTIQRNSQIGGHKK